MKKSFHEQIPYLGKYLRPHRTLLIFSLLLSIISAALGMIQPYFAKILIDRVFIARESGLLIPLMATLVALLIAGFLIRVSNSYIYTVYSARLLFKMREDLFAHLQRIPLSFFSKKKIGDVFSRIATDMADVQALLTETLPNYVFDFLTCVITAVILVWLNWKMALLSLCFLPFVALMIGWLRPRLLALAQNVAESNADIAHFLFETLGGMTLVRAFGAEECEHRKLQTKQSGMLGYLLRYQILGAFSSATPTVFVIINTLIVFGYGGFLVMENALSIGSLVAFSIYQGRVFAPLQGLMEGFLAMQKSRVALARVKEIFDIEPACPQSGDIIPADEKLRGDIAFEDVSFAYEKNEPVLKEQSFRIPAGKITALVGPSGVGKTTVCHLILRLFDPDSGRITVDGIDLRNFNTGWLRKQIAIVSQDTFLFHASIRENIGYPKPSAGEKELVEAAKAACIHDFIESLPEGYDTLVGDRGVRLSGGQKQRISIARSILIDPKILILDEATAFLDPSIEDRLKESIRVLMENRTILVVSHRASTIQGAEKIIALEKDGLAYQGPFEKFIDAVPPDHQAGSRSAGSSDTVKRAALTLSPVPAHETGPMDNTSIDIAIIDSGVNPWHSHVGGVEGGVAFVVDSAGRVTETTDFRDAIGHGTAIAGVIRERAPRARIYAVKIFHEDLTAPAPLLTAALEWVVARKIRLIHLSLGAEREEDREPLSRLCQQASDAGAVIIASARGPGDIIFPAAFDSVIGVYWNRDCENDSIVYHPEASIEFGACGWPRPLPGMPQEANFRGHSFAAARVTARAAELLAGHSDGGTTWVREELKRLCISKDQTRGSTTSSNAD